eukprot:TRINITY_DN3204_c0_g1_i4.p1 TRINITY_DN3204_c0_g1~~TRINITY_DN3204_c0_g1_i4.p1  ORF type:complete len:1563 (+),score=556.25 TRINITY_DN3204_c0_g1_i4:193-4689(+)
MTPELGIWQGPSLIIYNSGVFTDDDLQNITSLGKSEKYDDNTRIGKYGLGFNVVYHFTDVVSFISRDQLVMFDPHGLFLPQHLQGLRSDFVQEKLSSKYKAQMAPFNQAVYNSNIETPLNGTLMRLPLRQKKHLSDQSKISKATYDSAQMKVLLREFAEAAPSMLLFLKHVEEIVIYEKLEGSDQPTMIYSAKMRGVDDHLRQQRSLLNEYAAKRKTKKAYTLSSTYKISLDITSTIQSNVPRTSSEEWLIINGSATGMDDLEQQLGQIQWGGVAACLHRDGVSFPPIEGRAYCFLPLPIDTGLPIHVNAFFALSSNRRSLWMGQDSQGSAHDKIKWNLCTLTKTLPFLYGQLLFLLTNEILKLETEKNKVLYSYWPTQPCTPFQELSKSLLQDIASRDLKVFWDDLGKTCVSLKSVFFETKSSKLACDENLRELLKKAKISLSDPPVSIRNWIKELNIDFKTATPSQISQEIRKSPLRHQLTRQEAESFITFALHPSPTTAGYLSLNDVTCLPLVNGNLGKVETSKPSKFFYTIKPEYVSLIEEIGEALDATSRVYNLLVQVESYSCLNVKLMDLTFLCHHLDHVFPKTWRNRSCVEMKKPGQKIQGNSADAALALAQDAVQVETQVEVKGWVPAKQKKKLKKKVPTAPTVPTDSNLADPAVPAVVYDYDLIKKRLLCFWNFIENSEDMKSDSVKLFEDWPVILTCNGYLISIAYALQRHVIPSDHFSESERVQLENWGVLFLDPDFSGHRIRQIAAIHRRNACRALASSQVETRSQVENQDLRLLILQWISDKRDDILDASSLRSLPIFHRTDGNLDKAVGYPAVLSPPSAVGDSWESSSPWDEPMNQQFPGRVLSYSSEQDLILLKKSETPRTPIHRFIVDFLLRNLFDLKQDTSVLMLEGIAQTLPTSKLKLKELLSKLNEETIIVTDDRERKFIRDFADPEDPVFQELCQDTGFMVPEKYRNSPALHVMQKCGMKSVKNREGFLLAARMVSEKRSIMGAQLLVENFVQFRHEKREFTQTDFRELNSLSWIPAWELSTCPMISTWISQIPTSSQFKSMFQLERPPNSKKKPRKTRGKFDEISQEVEDLDFSDEDEFGPNPFDTCDMLDDLKKSAGKLSQREIRTTLTLVATGHVTTSLNRCAWFTWMKLPILPKQFENLPAEVLVWMNIHSVPEIPDICGHLQKLSEIWSSEDQVSSLAANKPLVQASILASCYALHSILQTKPHQVTQIRRNLSGIPFVLTEDLQFVLASTLLYDLEFDLSENARAPPPYLLPFENLMKTIGTPDASTECPKVIISAAPVTSDLGSLIRNCFNSPDLSDVHFLVEGKIIYAHKLVLGLTCEFFKVMLASGMKESTTSVMIVECPDWVQYEALFIMLKYLYVGGIDATRFQEVTSETSDLACSLLRLADQYLLDYVKQFCEHFLSKNSVTNLHTVCDLLLLADQANAKQLKAVCVFSMRSMMSALVQLPQWKEMPPELVNLVMAIPGHKENRKV